MLKLLKGGFILFIAILSQTSFAQNYYNSPYTRYGIGDLINTGFAANRSMGGSAIALRYHNQINYLNPAAYTSQDTNSFLFQAGFNAKFVNVETINSSDQSNNMNIEYLAIGVPIKKWLNVSAGLVPYSRIQYNLTQSSDSVSTGENHTKDYSGFGGFNEFYVGAGLTLMKTVSLGVNFKYLFGSLDRKSSSYLSETATSSSSIAFPAYYSAKIENEKNIIASDFYSTLGIQIHPTINEKHTLIIGATLDAKVNIDIKEKDKTRRINTAADDSDVYKVDTITIDEIENTVTLPNKLGFGISYSYNDQYLITADYITQDWTGMNIAESNFTNGKYNSYRFGLEYVPSPANNKARVNYFERIHYRAGGYYTESYLYYNNSSILNKGVSVGLGLPMKNSRNMFAGSALNIGYQFGIRGTTDNGLIKETYHMVTLGLTLHDFWFFKPKYN